MRTVSVGMERGAGVPRAGTRAWNGGKGEMQEIGKDV